MAPLICPFCERANSRRARFCMQCGSRLEIDANRAQPRATLDDDIVSSELRALDAEQARRRPKVAGRRFEAASRARLLPFGVGVAALLAAVFVVVFQTGSIGPRSASAEGRSSRVPPASNDVLVPRSAPASALRADDKRSPASAKAASTPARKLAERCSPEQETACD